ncbi:hypothetical protein HUG17_9452 [Dermatophagoides farinae]|uniref:Uncharacterized protein n=1 Tax=Dermatophagoides farinae TaxID=6954 RepID=A0A9D4SE44_DERFA|nr:hypothetical protein HUG17_9452 [Dermatophagoides farinae]
MANLTESKGLKTSSIHRQQQQQPNRPIHPPPFMHRASQHDKMDTSTDKNWTDVSNDAKIESNRDDDDGNDVMAIKSPTSVQVMSK